MTDKTKATWDWFKSFFSENDGASTTRALNWIWTVTMCSALLFVIVFNAIKTKEAKLPPIDSGYIMITGAFLAAKVGQHVFGEQGNDNNAAQIPPIPPVSSVVMPSAPGQESTVVVTPQPIIEQQVVSPVQVVQPVMQQFAPAPQPLAPIQVSIPTGQIAVAPVPVAPMVPQQPLPPALQPEQVTIQVQQ